MSSFVGNFSADKKVKLYGHYFDNFKKMLYNHVVL